MIILCVHENICFSEHITLKLQYNIYGVYKCRGDEHGNMGYL